MLRNRLIPIIGLAAVHVWAQTSPILAGGAGDRPVRISTAWLEPVARPGDPCALAVVLDIAERFHINPAADQLPADGANVIPTAVQVTAPVLSLKVGPVQFPPPRKIEVHYTAKPSMILALDGRAIVYVPVLVNDTAPPGPATLNIDVRYQACDPQICLLPQTESIQATITIVEPAAAINPASGSAALFAGFDSSVFATMSPGPQGAGGGSLAQNVDFYFFQLDPSGWLGWLLLLATAAFGGLLLNFMPCVLPVIPIKIMSLARTAGNRRRCLALGLSMSLGVVAFWLMLGGMIAAVSGFTAANHLFKYPTFTIGVGLVIAVMAMGMCGLFAFRLPRFVYAISPTQESHAGSFGFGIMTAVLSTPCAAPFMGAAATWAVKQAPSTTLSTFAAIGAGMALPYLVLSSLPHLVEKLPRSGPASELIKQTMGLLMLAAAAYFVGVGLTGWLKPPADPPSLAHWWAVAAFVAAAGAWMACRTPWITPSGTRRAVFVSVGIISVAAAVFGGVRLTDRGPIDWVDFTPQRFAEAKANGQVVVMEFTAEWCLNCKALERTVLNDPTIVALLREEGVVPMKVDLTGNNPQGRQMLQEVGHVTIPVLVVFSAQGDQTLNRNYYWVPHVVEAVRAARAEPVVVGR